MAFVAGQKLTAAQLNSAAPVGETQSASNQTVGTTTSTSYTDTLTSSTTVTLAFTAPASGSVEVTVQASMKNSTTNYTAAAFRLSGASSRASDDADQIFVQGTSEHMLAKSTIVTGLTPGGSYTITMQHKVVGASTGTYNYRRLAYRPIAA